MITPTAPGTRKAACQVNDSASHATSGGATMAPNVPPATDTLLAVARSDPGNHVVTTRSCAGKAVGSLRPSTPRKNANDATERVKPAPMHAADHVRMPVSMTSRAPKRSTSQPATGYIAA